MNAVFVDDKDALLNVASLDEICRCTGAHVFLFNGSGAREILYASGLIHGMVYSAPDFSDCCVSRCDFALGIEIESCIRRYGIKRAVSFQSKCTHLAIAQSVGDAIRMLSQPV